MPPPDQAQVKTVDSAAAAELRGNAMPRIDGQRQAALADSFHPVAVSFEKLRGISRNQLLGNEPIADPEKADLLQQLHEIIHITHSTMVRMNESHPGLPPDTIERTFNLVTRPGAETVVLRGMIPEKYGDRLAVLGYGIVIKGTNNFLDEVPHIDPKLIENPDTRRVIRLFVTQDGREYLARGEAFSKIFDKILERAGKEPLIGMMLTGIKQIEGQFSPDLSVAPWLEALAAAVSRGATKTGSTLMEIIDHPELNQKVGVEFEYYHFNADSKERFDNIAITKARYAASERKDQEQMAWQAPVMPFTDELVLMWARPHYFYNAAYLWPRNKVVGGTLPGGAKSTSRPERRPNLEVMPGDSSGILFPENSVGGIAVLGALPFIASDQPAETKEMIRTFLRNQVHQLKVGGMLVVRNPVKPDWPRQITAKFSTTAEPGKPSVLDQFLRFTKSATKEPTIPADDWNQIVRIDGSDPGGRLLIPSSIAREFALKYFQKDLEDGRKRTFAPDTAAERDAVFDGLNVRRLYDGPEFNHWLDEAHIKKKMHFFELGGSKLEIPTNHVTYLEKVEPGEGVRIKMESALTTDYTKFVSIEVWKGVDPDTGETILREVADRKNVTHTLKTFAIDRGRLLMQVRVYPRPLSTVSSFLDGSTVGGYHTEQVAAIVPPETLANEAELSRSIAKILEKRAGVDAAETKNIFPPRTMLAEGDALKEQLVSQAVEIAAPSETHQVDTNLSGFSTLVKVKMVDGVQLLNQCQVGSHQDARTEAAVYEISHDRGLSVGAWVGARPHLEIQRIENFHPTPIEEVLNPPKRAIFSQKFGPANREGFLDTWAGTFVEQDSTGKEVGRCNLEWVTPGEKSGFTPHRLPITLVMNVAGPNGIPEVYVGIEMRDLPAAQAHSGSSLLPSVPIFTATKEVTNMTEARAYAKSRLKEDFGIEVDDISQLGGKYFTSPGIGPTVMYPMIAEVKGNESNLDKLRWVRLKEFPEFAKKIACGQLLTAQYRANHALGLLES